MGQVIARVLNERPLMLYVLQVFKKIEKQLPQLTTLDLQYVSPELLKAKNLDLAVPGRSSCKYSLQVPHNVCYRDVP